MMPETENPYAAPDSRVEHEQDPSLDALHQLVFGWEKRRMFYNISCLIPGLITALMCLAAGIPFMAVLMVSFVVAAGANIAFFLGPLFELYLVHWNKRPPGTYTRTIFITGMVFSYLVLGGMFLMALLLGFSLGVNPI